MKTCWTGAGFITQSELRAHECVQCSQRSRPSLIWVRQKWVEKDHSWIRSVILRMPLPSIVRLIRWWAHPEDGLCWTGRTSCDVTDLQMPVLWDQNSRIYTGSCHSQRPGRKGYLGKSGLRLHDLQLQEGKPDTRLKRICPFPGNPGNRDICFSYGPWREILMINWRPYLFMN